MMSSTCRDVRPLSASVLAMLVVLAIGFMVGGAATTPIAGQVEERATSVSEAGEPASEPRIVVYYFHGKYRCKTCRTIEAYAEEAVKSSFQEELESGALAWEVVNVDQAGNEHYLFDFELPGSSLVVVEMENGQARRFQVLQEVWTLVGDKDGFFDYVRRSIGGFLG